MSLESSSLSELKVILEPYVQNEKALSEINEHTHFINDLEINSANLVDVVLDVEDKYDIEIDNESMESMLTVKDALKIIESKVNSST